MQFGKIELSRSNHDEQLLSRARELLIRVRDRLTLQEADRVTGSEINEWLKDYKEGV